MVVPRDLEGVNGSFPGAASERFAMGVDGLAAGMCAGT